MTTLAENPSPETHSATGFQECDFAVFDIPEFAGRMAALRAQLKPKLTEIGAEATATLSGTVQETLYPHVAQHLRRSVNPPVATWVAFARSNRAYKPFVHLRCAVMRQGVRATVFVEDYADDKELFAHNLDANAKQLARYLSRHPEIQAFTILDKNDQPLQGKALTEQTLKDFAARMLRVKGQHAIFGIDIPGSHPAIGDIGQLTESFLAAAQTLRPLYDCGKPGFKYVYRAEKITD
jgi:uncharacterized protein YktB (UPF0637 family)